MIRGMRVMVVEAQVDYLKTCISNLQSEIREYESNMFLTSLKSVVKLCEDEIWERQQEIEKIRHDIVELEGVLYE